MTRLIANPTELRHLGFQVVARNLGWVNAVRFLQQFDAGHGDYTRERRRFLPVWDAKTLVDRASRLTPRRPARRSHRNPRRS